MGLFLGGPLLKPQGAAPVPSGVTRSSAFTLAGSLTDFSLLVDLSLLDATWWNAIDTADFTKGRAYKADDTELAVDWINPVNNMDGTGTGYARVKWSGAVTSGTLKLSSPLAANASVAAGDTYGQYSAYDSGTRVYYPCEESSGNLVNRVTGLSATAGGTPIYGVSGKAGGAIDCNDSGHFTGQDIDGDFASAGFTVSIWVNNDTIAIRNVLYTDLDPTGTYKGFSLQSFSNGQFYADMGVGASPGVRNNVAYTAGVWQHWAATYDNAVWTLYLNGVSVDTAVRAGAYSDPAATLKIGNSTYPNDFIDEIRVDATPRSSNWIASEFSQTNDNAAFWGTWS